MIDNYNILVLGSTGMAGHLIIDYLSENKFFSVNGIHEKYFRSSQKDYLDNIDSNKPDVIINALRMTISDCQENPQKAILINSIIPKILENYYYSSKVRLIHLSTDCVFSGAKGNYSENDIPDGGTIYSMTKFCGEIINNKDITIRTSYIGPNLKNKKEELFDWFLNQKGKIEGYADSIWNGVTTLELARNIEQLILKNQNGLFHLCSTDKISKYSLLCLIKKQWKREIDIKHVNRVKIDRSLVNNRKDISVVNYKTMFKQLFDYMEQKQHLYAHYKN